VTAGVGSRRLALAVASQRQPALRAASRMGGVYCGVGMLGDGVVFLGGLEDSIFKCQAESSKFVRNGQVF